LREDRNRCAHPSFHRIEDPYRPSAEQARLHLRNAIVHVLSQEPVQGRAALDQIISLVSSKFFPKDADKALIQLKGSEFSNPRPSLVNGVIDSLLFGFLDDGSPLKFSRNAIAALKASLILHRQIAEARIALQIRKIFRNVPDNKMTEAAYIVLDIPEGWQSLDQAYRDKVGIFIKTSSDALPLLRLALKIPELESAATDRIRGLTEDEISEVILKYELAGQVTQRAIELYTSVHSWDRANTLYEKVLSPLVKFLSAADIDQILRSPSERGADLLGSHSFSTLIDELYRRTDVDKDQMDTMLEKHGLEAYKANR
jgi:hypothetical protein